MTAKLYRTNLGSFISTADNYLRIAREEKLTLRELAYRAACPRPPFVGTPEQIADQMQEAYEEKAVDGFILGGTHAELREFNARVLPVLRARGLFREEYESTTLRGNLGLDYPVNRHTAARPSPRLSSRR